MSDCRWIEDPKAVGLRLVGLAHEVSPAGYQYLRNAVEHTGWFLNDFQDETVCGVVYQLPGKNGRARYLAGYADPWNCDSSGNGPAYLDLDPIEGERLESSRDSDSGKREAAMRADDMARRMAEDEREYQRHWMEGNAARELAEEAREACARWAEDVRTVRDFFRMRHAAGARLSTLKTLIRHARASCEEFTEKLDEARAARREGMHNETFREAYHNG